MQRRSAGASLPKSDAEIDYSDIPEQDLSGPDVVRVRQGERPKRDAATEWSPLQSSPRDVPSSRGTSRPNITTCPWCAPQRMT